MLLEESELLDGDAARIGVGAEALVADPDPDGFWCRAGCGDEHERGHEADERCARSWSGHHDVSIDSSLRARADDARPVLVRGVGQQSETKARQSMSRAVEFVYVTAVSCGRLWA